MNLVIMGESRSGKTFLANLLCSNIVGYNKISIDYLVMTFKKVFPELDLNYYERKENKFYEFLEEYFDNCCYKEPNGIKYILEGACLPYEAVLRLNKKENTKVIFLGKTELSPQEFFNEIRSYEKNLSTGGWTKMLDDEKLLNWCTSWINKSKEHKKFCEENNILYIDTSFNQQEILHNLLNILKIKN